MTDLARLTISLSADNARLQRDLDKAQSQVNKFKQNAANSAAAFGKSVGTAVGIGIAAAATGLVVLIKNSIDAADELSLLAQKTGISTEALSQLQYAASQSGVEDLSTSLIKFNKNISEAASGSKEQVQAFKALGISQNEIAASSPEELFTRVAEQLSKYADGANKTGLAQKFFGKTGADLIPVLNEGEKGIARLRAEADKLGLTIGSDTAKAANDFNDSLDRLKAGVSGVGRQIVTDLTPRLTQFADFMSDPQTIENLSKFGAAIVSSLGAAVETVTALTSGATRLYDFLASTPTELVDVMDELARIERELNQRKNGGFLDQFNNSAETLDELKTRLDELIKKRDELFAKQRADLQKPPVAEPPKPPAPIDTSALEEAAKKAAEARKKIADASAQAETTVFAAQLDRRQSLLEASFEQQKVTYSDYQKALLAIQQEGIDREIAQRQSQLANADPAERIKLLAEIEAFQTKRLQVSEETDAAIESHSKKLNDALIADMAGLQAQLDTLGQSYQRALDDFGKGPAQRRYDSGRNSIDDNVSQQRIALENQKRAGEIDQATFDNSLSVLEDFHGKAIEQWDAYYAAIEERSTDFSLGFQEAFAEYADAVKNVGQSLGGDLASALDNAISQTADLAANTILWGEGGTEALKALGRSIITDVVGALIQAGIQMAVNFALQKAFSAAATATAAGEAAALATIWTPAAIAASIATLGSADAIGVAAYGAAQASGQALTGVGFADGGYTGDGPASQIAGVVHKGEYVLNARALDAMNAGRFAVPGASAMKGSGSAAVQIINNAPGVKYEQRGDVIYASQTDDMAKAFEAMFARGVLDGRGQLGAAISQKYGVQASQVR